MSSAGRNQTQLVMLSCSTFLGILGHHHQQALNSLNLNQEQTKIKTEARWLLDGLVWFTSNKDRNQGIFDAKSSDYKK